MIHTFILRLHLYLHYTKTNQEGKAKCHLKNNLCTHTKRLKIEKKSKFDENNLYFKIFFNVRNVVRTPSVIKRMRFWTLESFKYCPTKLVFKKIVIIIYNKFFLPLFLINFLLP